VTSPTPGTPNWTCARANGENPLASTMAENATVITFTASPFPKWSDNKATRELPFMFLQA